MKNQKTITIDGIEYVPKSSIKTTSGKQTKLQIVILHRGWIIIGEYREEKDEFVCENSYVIRRYGTTKGLGELALEGPQTNTKLDACGVVRSLKTTIVARLDVDESKWANQF